MGFIIIFWDIENISTDVVELSKDEVLKVLKAKVFCTEFT